jgi:hypothetical protein
VVRRVPLQGITAHKIPVLILVLLVAQPLLQQAVVGVRLIVLLEVLEVLAAAATAAMLLLAVLELLDRGTTELPELLEMAVFIMLAAEAEALVL